MVEQYLGPESGGVILGIDPGMKGALAFYGEGPLDQSEYFTVFDMPVFVGGKKQKPAVDAAGVASIIEKFQPKFAMVEKVNAMKGWGIGSCFRFGESYGVVRGVLAALKISTHLVAPQTWKKHFGLPGGNKEASRRLVIERWPQCASLFARVKDEGRAEAALIAAYGKKELT